MTRSARTLRLVAATVLVAAAGLVLPAGPAAAATCANGDGVSVVVDFHELGGGVQTACVEGGRSASALFSAAGFTLTPVQRQPGFVCKVDAKPDTSCANTPPADAYWGLWWSDGRSGKWSYANSGVGSLTVPNGGSVAFSWNDTSAGSAPGIRPAAHRTAPTPTAKPSTKPTKKAAGAPTVRATKPASIPPSSAPPSATSSATPSPSPTRQKAGKAARPTKSPGAAGGDTPSEAASQTPSSSTPSPMTSSSADPADPSNGGLPTWVGPVVVVVLFAAGGAVAVVRRRRSPTP